MSSYPIAPSDFCRDGNVLEGKVLVADLERLSAECTDTTSEIVWKVTGMLDAFRRPRLLLSVFGNVHLVCQRCLGTMPYRLVSETAVIVTFSEAEADEIEAMLEDDDDTEVIVVDGKVDVMNLIEDEALLALPLSSRHEVCPNGSVGNWTEKKASPFKVLEKLKRENSNKK